MPCIDYYPEGYGDPNYKTRDQLTQMLCGLCKQATPEQIADVAGLSDWWFEHQRRDVQRQKEEAEKQDKKQRRARRNRALYEQLKAKFEG